MCHPFFNPSKSVPAISFCIKILLSLSQHKKPHLNVSFVIASFKYFYFSIPCIHEKGQLFKNSSESLNIEAVVSKMFMHTNVLSPRRVELCCQSGQKFFEI